MKRLAYTLVAAGFLAGALVAVQTPKDQVGWTGYGLALLVGVAGAVLARSTRRRQACESSTLQVNRQQLEDRLRQIVIHAGELDREKERLPPAEIAPRIDDLFRRDLDGFADARETISHLYGLGAYAEVMNEFAAGERYLNRAWSASVDGYVDEAQEYVAKARQQFEQTQAALNRHVQSEPRPLGGP